jgi:hypothetical protein
VDRWLAATVHELAALAVYFVTGEQPTPADEVSASG